MTGTDVNFEVHQFNDIKLEPAMDKVNIFRIDNTDAQAFRYNVFNGDFLGHLDLFINNDNGTWRFVEYKKDGDRAIKRENMNFFTATGLQFNDERLLDYVSELIEKYHGVNESVGYEHWENAEQVPEHDGTLLENIS